MEQELYQRLLAETREERLLWHGRPGQGLRLRSADLYLIPFSLLWGGFAIVWEIAVLSGGKMRGGGEPTLFMAVFGGVFVLIGLYLIFGRFFYDAWRRARVYYGLTSRRVIILEPGGSSVRSLDLAQVPEINLKLSRNGAGSIIFGTEATFSTRRQPAWSGGFGSPAFEFIPDARAVYDLAVGAQAGKLGREQVSR